MTQGVYGVYIDINRDRYLAKGIQSTDTRNIVDNPERYIVTDQGTPTSAVYFRELYSTTESYFWSVETGTGANSGINIGDSPDDYDSIYAIAGGSRIVSLEFIGISGYSGEQITWTVSERDGMASTSDSFILTGDYVRYELPIAIATDYIVIQAIRTGSTNPVVFRMRNLFISGGSAIPTAFNTGAGSDILEDVTTYVMGMSWNNGMDNYQQEVSGGARASIVLDNRDGLFYQDDQNAIDIITNGNFALWNDIHTPEDWNGTNIDSDNETTEVGSGELHGGTGTGAANLYADSNQWVVLWQGGSFVAGQRYKVTFVISATADYGGVRFYSGSATPESPISRIYATSGYYEFFFTAVSDGLFITNNRAPCDITIDNVAAYLMPLYAGLAKGTLVSIRMIAEGEEYQMYIGSIADIRLTGSRYDVRTVTLECTDVMERINQLEYIPGIVSDGGTTLFEFAVMFQFLLLPWPYAKDYWMLGTSVLGFDTVLFGGNSLYTLGSDTVDLAYPVSGAGTDKGISASAYIRDLITVEHFGRFYIDSRTGKIYVVLHDYDASLSSFSALSDDTFDLFDHRYADDIINQVTGWFKQKLLGEDGNVILWESTEDIAVPGKSDKSITGRYRDPDNDLIEVSAVDTQPILRNIDYVISPNPNNARVTVTADAGGQSVTFSVNNDRQIDVTVTTLQIRGLPLYTIDNQSVFSQNADSIYYHDIFKQDYNFPLLSDFDTVQGIITAITSIQGNAINRLDSITFSATKDDARYLRTIATVPATAYNITSSLLGMNADYIVIGERHSVSAGGENTHMVTWILKPGARVAFWILGVTGRSELGVNTIPIF